jgi:hypothetical protein
MKPGLIIFCLMPALLAQPAAADDASARAPASNLAFDLKSGGTQWLSDGVSADSASLDRLFGAVDYDVLQPAKDAQRAKGWLGIAMKLPGASSNAPAPDAGHSGQSAFPVPAVEVARVLPDSAAARAGLREGDLIAGLNGAPLEPDPDKRLAAFRLAVAKMAPGSNIKLKVLRAGAGLEFDAVIQPYPHVNSVLKPHADLDRRRAGTKASLLSNVLKKGRLTDEFARLLGMFREEADKAVSPLVKADTYNPFRLQEVNYVMYHPLELPQVARKITDRLQDSFDATHHDLEGLLDAALGELDMPVSGPSAEKPPADFTAYVERLVAAIQYANAERVAVLSVLSGEEVDFLYKTLPGLLEEDPDAKRTAQTTPADSEAQRLKLYGIVLKLDLPRLLNASARIAHAIDLKTLETLDVKSGRLTHIPPGWKVVRRERNLTVLDTPAGRVLIGGTGDNVYTEDAALIIDLGGNDTYLNRAGGSSRQIPFSVAIDLAGDDLYDAPSDSAQGAGFIGGGFLVDLKGDDHYIARNFAQGSGMLGVGVLADLSGHDQYTAVAASQGAGAFGIGLLADAGGNDQYSGARFVQGFGYVKGFGAIVDAAGNDQYFAGGQFEDFRAPGKSYQSMGQGFGFGDRPWESLAGASGGIGVLLDLGGNDTYVADYFAQGSSYWYALGILDDRHGNDRYLSGRYSQGAGIHMSAGVLMDGDGDDTYLADFGVAQGCGHDLGIGFLLDGGGNDRYISGVIAEGAGNDNGIGVLADSGGDDEYHVKSLGQGYGSYGLRDMGSFGVLFDTGGGNDSYTLGGANGRLMYESRWGILLDTD